MKWTAEMDALLKKLCGEGISRSRAAHVINNTFGLEISRNAVIGRAMRIGVPTMKTTRRVYTRHKKSSPKRPVNTRPEGLPRAWAQSIAPLPEPRQDDIPTKTFDDLEWNDGCCRHRIDIPYRGEKYGFCGKETIPGLSVCRTHAARWFANWAEIEPRYQPTEPEVSTRIVRTPQEVE